MLVRKIKDPELIVLNFRGQLPCRIGEKRQGPIEVYAKFWNLKPLEKQALGSHEYQLGRRPSSPSMNRYAGEEQECWSRLCWRGRSWSDCKEYSRMAWILCLLGTQRPRNFTPVR